MNTPFKKSLSENVEVLYGWKDAHAEVRVRLPIPMRPWYTVSVEKPTIEKFKIHFQDAHDHGMKPESERTQKEVVEFEARDDCRGRYGYPDGHVELGVKKLVWAWIKFTFEEFKIAKAAMDEAYNWSILPEETRDLQGVPK